jgi:predicted DNA-binding antitoxin AbrB/MazE fold protein
MRIKTATNTKKRRDPMAGTIRARFTNGVLEPLERLDVPEGEVLTITIIRLPTGEARGGLERSAGGWERPIDAEEVIKNIYADRTPFARWPLGVKGTVRREHHDA